MTQQKKSKPAQPETFSYDAIVIGTGPGGEGAAMNLTKKGLHVAVIERHSDVGGGCTHWGTIPSKALRHSVERLTEFNNNPLFSSRQDNLHLTFKDILQHTQGVVGKQIRMRHSFYERNQVDVIHGEASFVDPYTINVTRSDGNIDQLTAKQFVIATGSRPYRPADIDFSHPRIYDSDSILNLQHDPRNVIIYGAGVIGCEYASIFRGLNNKVELINSRDALLSFLDAEISDALSYHLRNNGANIRHCEEYASVTGDETGVVMELKSGKRMRADCFLFANGRTGNTDTLNLSAVGLAANSRGQLTVNSHYCTEVDNIFAVGDVIGYPSLASAAYDQGRIAADAMTKGQSDTKLIVDIPTGIYTIPEISSVGQTEQQLTEKKVPYEVGRAHFKHLARAQIADQPVGTLKLLFHRDTKEILGIHCFGERAAEIVHIGQAIMEQTGKGNTIDYFAHTTFNYPTMAEAYRVAALNGLNKLF
ncbi:Si-specific NAD(P)(+) transhydrogenase [Neiella marina]|uniref:Soluble pyridine nucleotide transhydrogenase n=1 Tax=Neiella holothuriorum TaxID=2870530 RepID=A0ABS7EGD9_9GAMM|nr:Si-specific NAD(P)(+) transhydrogenase [Neiella holothuriorum]MBW8191270.1 Si-specific NAD(P)(+) transhydrogenase [Neiella holothuriorum]